MTNLVVVYYSSEYEYKTACFVFIAVKMNQSAKFLTSAGNNIIARAIAMIICGRI